MAVAAPATVGDDIGLSALLDTMDMGVIRLDRQLRITYANRWVLELFGLHPGGVIGRRRSEIGVPAWVADTADAASLETMGDRTVHHYEWSLRVQGVLRHFSTRTCADLSAGGEVRGSVCWISDITDRHAAEEDTRNQQLLFHAFMNQSNLIAWMKDERGRYVYSSRAHQEFLGGTAADVLGRTDHEIWDSETAEQLFANDLAALGGEAAVESIERTRSAATAARFFSVRRFAFRDLANARFVGGVGVDVTERTLREEQVRRLSITDVLTGLMNRRGFYLTAEPELKRARRRDARSLLAFIDIDGLKSVNDNYGHEVGDHVLVAAADVLRHTFRDTDIVARLGGDEFVVLAPDAADEVPELMARLERVQRDRAPRGPSPRLLKLSMGFVVSPADDARSLEELVGEADEIMYNERRARRARRA